MPKQRAKTTVEVEVLDLSAYKESLFLACEDPDGTLLRLTTIFIYGRMVVDDRVYLLNSDGVGHEVTDDDPIVIQFHGEIQKENSNGISFFPVAQAGLTKSDILKLPVIEKKNLAEFIRSFGKRLESNYRQWRDFFERKA